MLGMQNAMERDADEWVSLLKRADARFKIDSFRSVKGSTLSMMEVIWDQGV